MNLITSADIALATSTTVPGPVRPVVFLNAITPGNYGFIQELGVATVLVGATKTQTAQQFAIVLSTAANGTLDTSSATYGPFAIGNILDPIASPLAGTTLKVLLDGPFVQD